MLDDAMLDWTVENYEAIASVAEGAGPEAPIVSCPGWTMSELLGHASNALNGWFTYNVSREPDDVGLREAMASAPPEPEGWEDRIGQLRSGTQRFAELVRSTDLDRPVWTFGLPHGRARFWLGRAATESAIHRWDAEGSVGEVSRMGAERSAASVDETIRGLWRFVYQVSEGDNAQFFGRQVNIPAPSGPVGIEATDSGTRWLLRADAGERSYAVIAGGAMPETVVSGDGHDLVLLFWGRNGARAPSGELKPDGLPVHPGATVREAAGLSVVGDPDLVDAWNFGALSEM